LCNSCASLAGLVLCFIACFILLVIVPLADDCHLIADARERRLRSAENRACFVTRTRAASVTEFLQLPALDYGTVYHHISDADLQLVPAVTKTFLFG